MPSRRPPPNPTSSFSSSNNGDGPPPEPRKPLSVRLKETYRAFGNTPRAFELVWAASPRDTLIMGLLTVSQALLPAAQAWAGKLIVDGVVNAITSEMAPRAGLTSVMPYLLLEFALLLAGTVCWASCKR